MTDPAPSKKQMNVRLTPALIDRIDARRRAKGLSRDEWVARALTYALERQPDPTRPTRPTR